MDKIIYDNEDVTIDSDDKPVDEELIAAAIAGVINFARSQGQSLDELTAEVLQEDTLLDPVQRNWLRDIVTQAWETLV